MMSSTSGKVGLDALAERRTDFLMTPDQVAKRLNVSVACVRDHSTRKHPRLPVVRVGGLLRFRPRDIDAWIETQVEGC